MTASGASVSSYVTGQRTLVRDALEPLVAGRTVVLLDAAGYANIGDCAITMGTLTALAELGATVGHVADHRHFSPTALGRALTGDTVILLQGGGNLGDLYNRNQEFRERIIRQYPDHQIVQLPQSIHFEDRTSAERYGGLVNGHGGVTVMVRDSGSLEAGREEVGIEAALVPDMAFALGSRPAPPSRVRTGVLYVLRSDREATRKVTPPDAVDWPSDRRLARRAPGFAGRWALERATRSGPWRASRAADAVGRHQLVHLAAHRVRSGLLWLGDADRIVSDRLHVHVLATLLGIPHVVVESRTGKVTSYLESWPGLAESFVSTTAGESLAELQPALDRLDGPAGG